MKMDGFQPATGAAGPRFESGSGGSVAEARQAKAKQAKKDGTSYWRDRIGSRDFEKRLAELFVDQLRDLAQLRVEQVVDPKLVREWIGRAQPLVADPHLIAEVVLHGHDAVTATLRDKNASLLGLLDRTLVKRIDDILDEDPVLSGPLEDFVGRLMREEFVERLFTDIIYASILSFQKRINPFGAFAMSALEDQVKGFIRLFLPVVQERAVAFAVSRTNQAVLFDFTRVIVRQVLDEPLDNLAGILSTGQRRKVEALLRESMGNRQLDALGRELGVTAWDAVYPRIRKRRVGELLDLEVRAKDLAREAARALAAVLQTDRVLALVNAEVERATDSEPAAPPPAPPAAARRRPARRASS